MLRGLQKRHKMLTDHVRSRTSVTPVPIQRRAARRYKPTRVSGASLLAVGQNGSVSSSRQREPNDENQI